MPGQTVRFDAGGREVARATTDADGVATAEGTMPLAQALVGQGYAAFFAGTENFGPSEDEAPLVPL